MGLSVAFASSPSEDLAGESLESAPNGGACNRRELARNGEGAVVGGGKAQVAPRVQPGGAAARLFVGQRRIDHRAATPFQVLQVLAGSRP